MKTIKLKSRKQFSWYTTYYYRNSNRIIMIAMSIMIGGLSLLMSQLSSSLSSSLSHKSLFVTSFMIPTTKLNFHHHCNNNYIIYTTRIIKSTCTTTTTTCTSSAQNQNQFMHGLNARRKRDYYLDDDDDEEEEREYFYENDKYYKDDFEYDDDDDYDNDYDYYDDDEEEEEEGDDDELPLEWEWETYQKNTHIYLPPPPPPPILPPISKEQPSEQQQQQQQTYPKTIIHFIGGTLFGSYPLQFYKQFLQDIAQKSNSIIVATSIPVSFQSNPLNHNKLCLDIVKAFRGAYRNVICDEYSRDVVREMKIVGLGHSLGSRLHCIITTDDDDQGDDNNNNEEDEDATSAERQRRTTTNQKRKKSLQKIAMTRNGNILIAFNNYSAMSSVPGVKTLEKGVRETRKEERDMKERIKEQKRKSRRQSRSRRDIDYDEYDDDDDYYFDREVERKREQRRYDDNDDYDFFYDDEDDLDLQDIITSIKSSLTPNIKKSSLEFQPAPDELWDKITNSYSKNIEKTLIVQFDNDGIDQSSRLAQEISDSTSASDMKDNEGDDEVVANVDSTTPETEKVPQKKEERNEEEDNENRILFARLKGTHLSPVTYTDSFGLTKIWQRLSALPMDKLLKEAIDEENAFKRRNKRKDKQASLKRDNLRDLTDSIARYIVDIIN